jgi:predicted Rossmann-fold nucleotide-binding protein
VSTLAERKHVMFDDVDAVLCYPGGIGTWDELFDLLARRSIDEQVHQLPPCPPIYLYDWEQFYAPLLLQLEVALEAGLIHPEAVAMMHSFGSAEELSRILGELRAG